MNFDAVVSIFKRIESISFYPICCFTDGQVVYPSEEQLKHTALAYDLPFARQLLLTDGLIQDSLFPDVFYYVCHYEQGLTCIMGPFSHRASQKDIQSSFCHVHHLPSASAAPIRKATREQVRNAATVISDMLHMHGIYELNTDLSLLSDLHVFTSAPDPSDAEQQQYVVQIDQMNSERQAIPRAPYSLEKALMEALKNDDASTFYALLRRMIAYQPGQYAYSSDKFTEYGVVMLVSSMTRAVIDGGVPAEDAYELSERILYKLSLAKGKQAYDQISAEAFSQFLSLVHRHRGIQTVSPHVRRCQAYIERHLNEELSANILADHLGLSRNYLLHLFPQEIGESLMDYIRKARMEAAQKMLKYSDQSIQQIADFLQFKTQSHFTQSFRKYAGMTPTEYRKRFQPNVT